MKPIRNFNVIPLIPSRLEGLRELALNLRWAWDHDSIELFRRLDTDLWESTGHNPVQMLGSIDQMRLVAGRRDDDAFLTHLERVSGPRRPAWARITWFRRVHSALRQAAGRILLRRVRTDGMPLDIRGRIGRSGGRSRQVGQRPGRAPGGRGPTLSAGLLSPVSEPGRMAAGRIRHQRFP